MLTLKLSQGLIFRILSGSSHKIALVTVHELMQGNVRKKRLNVLQDEIHNQQTNNVHFQCYLFYYQSRYKSLEYNSCVQ